MPSLLIKQIPERGLPQAWDIPGTGSLKWKKLGAKDGVQWKGTTQFVRAQHRDKILFIRHPIFMFF